MNVNQCGILSNKNYTTPEGENGKSEIESMGIMKNVKFGKYERCR